ncbi:retrovirus-related Pol polyprotein from transposon 412 [Trichonephila clavipes]|nr:retrovirus-related Pol polyprotein from transposon 412 [Trichonephila clavipes]
MPDTISQLRRFLAMLNIYRRFLPHAVEAQAPLNKLLTNCTKNGKRPVPWNEEADTAFMQYKSSLANVATLNYPSPDQQLCLLVDASNSAVGGALNCLTENGPQPIAFFSRKLSATETKYSTYHRELLALYLAIKHFRHQLEGHNFIIFTDHRPLTFAFNKISDSCSLRQLRHLDFISQFGTDIRHVSGSDNSVADTHSRINALNFSTTDLLHLADSQTKDEELKTLISSNDLSIKLKPLKIGNALEIFCDVSRENVRPYVPVELRFEVFRSLQNLSHPGIRATKRLIQDPFV